MIKYSSGKKQMMYKTMSASKSNTVYISTTLTNCKAKWMAIPQRQLWVH